MKSWLKVFVLALLFPAAVFAAETGDKKKEKAAAASTEAKGSPEEQRENAVLEDLPTNQTYDGLRIPNLDPNGKLLSLFVAKSAKRVDARNLEMTDLQIEIHNPDGTTFIVQMAHSLFNLDSRILTSDTPATIKSVSAPGPKSSGQDFVINGERAEFNTKTRFGRMFGNVKMIINSENVK